MKELVLHTYNSWCSRSVSLTTTSGRPMDAADTLPPLYSFQCGAQPGMWDSLCLHLWHQRLQTPTSHSSGATLSESDVAATGNQWTSTHGPRSRTHHIKLIKSLHWTLVPATRLKKSLINLKCENKPVCLSLWPSARPLLAISLTSALKLSVQLSMQAQPYWCHDMDKLVTDQLILDSVFRTSICISARAANVTCQRLEGLTLLPDSAWIHSKRSHSN